MNSRGLKLVYYIGCILWCRVQLKVMLVVGFGAHKFDFVEDTIDFVGGIVKSGLWVPFDLIF